MGNAFRIYMNTKNRRGKLITAARLIALQLSVSLVIFNGKANAQFQSTSYNDEVKNLNKGYQQMINQANDELMNANTQLNNCNRQHNATATGRANPSLEEVPDNKMTEVGMAMLPHLSNMGPALPDVMNVLKGVKTDATQQREAAIQSHNEAIDIYNNQLQRLAQQSGTTATPISIKKISPTNKTIRYTQMTSYSKAYSSFQASCSGTQSQTDSAQYHQRSTECHNLAMQFAQSISDAQSAMQQANYAADSSQHLMGSAITASAAGFMASKSHDENAASVKRQNEITAMAANNELDACREESNNRIKIAKRKLAQVEAERADALRDLALRKAAEQKLFEERGNIPVDGVGDKLKPINPGAPTGALASTNGMKSEDPGAGGGGGAGGGAGGAPGAGGGGGGSPQWGFGGGGDGNYLGGGLPAQEAGATFAASGGGGIFSEGFAENTEEFSSMPGSEFGSSGEASRGLASDEGFGDGGLNVMMARMRLRFAYHAGELMQGVDLKSLAQKTKNASESQSSAQDKSSSEDAERAPASKY